MMHISLPTKALLKSVARMQGIVQKQSNMRVLSTILLSAYGSKVRVSATDLELGFEQEVDAEVKEEGEITISGRKLFEILRESKDGDFEVREEENNWVSLSDGVAHFRLAGIAADQFPSFGEPEGIEMIELDGSTLREMVRKTIYSTGTEEGAFKISGVFTEAVEKDDGKHLRMVATDGHRLSLVDREVEGLGTMEFGGGIMIPKKGMVELEKLASESERLNIGIKEKELVIKGENGVLVVRLLDTKFPDYNEVIPEETLNKVRVERSVLLEAMKRMVILSTDRYKAVKLGLKRNTMDLVSTNPELGEAKERLDVEYSGEEMECGFNPRYFIDILQSMESEEVEGSFVDTSRPCVIRGAADEGFLGLIMPMRL